MYVSPEKRFRSRHKVDCSFLKPQVSRDTSKWLYVCQNSSIVESKSYSARYSEIMPYSLILATLFSYKLFSGIPRSRVDTLYWTVFSGLFLFTALRNKVGCDWGNYQRTFYFNWEMTIGEALTRGEPVFWLVVYMLHDLGLQYHWLNIVTTAVFFFGLFKFSKEQSDP